jgi:hypothetical protein
MPHFQSLYLVPEPHALETVWEICDAMPEALLSNTNVHVGPFWCASIEDDEAAALYARLRYSGPPPGWGAEELPFARNEIVVPDDERANTEEMLQSGCRSAATWHRIVTITAPMEAHEAFQTAREFVLAYHAELDDLERLVDEEIEAVRALLDGLDARGRP